LNQAIRVADRIDRRIDLTGAKRAVLLGRI
jgi:hypothetical protein